MNRTLSFLAGLAAGIALAAALSGKAHRPRDPSWQDHPDHEMPVRWVRVEGFPQSEVRDGVCVIYLPDRGDAGLRPAEGLIRACAATGRTDKAITGPDIVNLRWWATDPIEVQHRYDDIRPATGVLRPGARPSLSARWFGGFYWRDQRGCGVVTATGRQVLGHEIKHCFDGDFHP